MKVAIVGSREYPHLAKVREYILNLPQDTIIVSGGARGVDKCASNSHYGKFASISLMLLRIGAIENLEKPITSLKTFSLGNLWAT